ncbi:MULTISPECIES: ATP-binding cassette domain-containing protein [unclassified Paenibacillus]|uniref:ABC transporter ATP-binding protein n=1 Tax=unclassified Paenibacillus TaxID=185978 RepID=UPI0009569F1C|nr:MULTISPECIES: ATP-binding cassette domain-containing protein [unclassified Paenibacillus]ASS67048.2 ATP-binding cassette domain-containing protein [Paenibacillus sp. RUD330]SIR48209.1 energy-coupling factor transport system ATP-binding protein [Paenibacillus sp. RU4X]SIR57631.1 energy-coupling factor transport system ATP-binding protein [Paenibacillus sp. RU4T]
MAHYQIENVSFRYAGADAQILEGVSVDIEEGDFVLLCGPSGCGKTTLLRQLKNEVRPAGKMEGSIRYGGASIEELPARRSVEEIGMVFQHPDSQIVMNTVWQELVFAMENLGYPAEQIQRRIGELVPFFGMEEWLHRQVHELSGGQKQLLSLASVMSLRPKALLLDEPTAQLDPIAAREFIGLLARINEEMSITVIISEHRLEDLFPLVTKALVLREGRVAYAGSPGEVARRMGRSGDGDYAAFLPSATRLYLQGGGDEEDGAVPLTVRDGKRWLQARTGKLDGADGQRGETFMAEAKPASAAAPPGKSLLTGKGLYFAYEKDAPMVLGGLDLDIREGELFALFGSNGSGKSTLLQVIAGVIKPLRGSLSLEGESLLRKRRSGSVGYVAQNPLLYFTRDTVGAQLDDRLERLGLDKRESRLQELLELFGLEGLESRHPFDLSGGQQQKLALLLVLLGKPRLLLLDEPTKGLDPLFKGKLAGLLGDLRRRGTTILMVSHDVEFAASHADRCGLLFDGRMAAAEETRSFMRENYFYTTAVQRAAGSLYPEAVVLEDVPL